MINRPGNISDRRKYIVEGKNREMGKKEKTRNNKKGKRGVGGDSDEDMLTGNGTVIGDDEEGEEEPVTTMADLLIEAVDKLSEKRSSTRVAGLASLVKILRSQTLDQETLEMFSGYYETVTSWLKKGLKVSTPEKESVLCSQLVCLMALVIGPDEEDFVTDFSKPLSIIVRSCDNENMRVWALTARTFIGFVCATELAWAQQLLTFCEEVFSFTDEFDGTAVTNGLRVAAFNMWSVTAAYYGSTKAILSRSKNGVFDACLEALDGASDDAGVKIAAGECMALLWEVAEQAHAEGDVQILGDGSTTIAKPSIFDEVFNEVDHGPREDDGATANGVFGFAPENELEFTPANEARFVAEASTESLGILLTEEFDDIDRAQHLLKQLARESSKKVSKKDRKEIRSGFRALEEWILEGTAPSEECRMSGAVIEAQSFAEIKRLDLVRTVMADGLPTSLRNFSVVCDIFEVEQTALTDHADGDGVRSVVAKGSMTAKNRSQALRRDRRARADDIDAGWGSD